MAIGDTGSMVGAVLPECRAALDRVMAGFVRADRVRGSPFTHDRRQAERWLERAHGAMDGVIANNPYATRKRDMLKVKTHRTADCVVGGFRYGKETRQVGSILLGLFDADGRLDHVGFTSGISDAERPALTQRLEALQGGVGFTGDAPQLRPGHRRPLPPRDAMLLRWRPDKAPRQCTRDQIGDALRLGKLVEAIL